MMVRVLMFAQARETIGESAIELELPEGSTVESFRKVLSQRFPSLVRLLPQAMISVDQVYANNSDRLHHGAEVGIIPPVGGG
ncbi:MAG: MoaD/ThiS family protein [Pirellulaceae bacterium]